MTVSILQPSRRAVDCSMYCVCVHEAEQCGKVVYAGVPLCIVLWNGHLCVPAAAMHRKPIENPQRAVVVVMFYGHCFVL